MSIFLNPNTNKVLNKEEILFGINYINNSIKNPISNSEIITEFKVVFKVVHQN